MTPGKITTELDDDLFDDTAGYDDETGIKFAPSLTQKEREQATVLYRLFNELWGLCIVLGDPGTGKDLFGNHIAHKIKTFFPWKRILRDEKPRRLFGTYAGLFNEQVLKEDLQRMRLVAKGKKDTEDNGDFKIENFTKYGQALEKMADDWVVKDGQVLLKNSVLYLTEFWRYCYNREPHSPMNKTMGAIHKMYRHLDCLVIGTVQQVGDLDKKTCLKWVNWKVTCTRSKSNPTGFVYYVQKVKYDMRVNDFMHMGQPFPIAIDAGMPRSNYGDGKIMLKRPNYIPTTEEEDIVLYVIKQGAEYYEDIVNIIEQAGDMTRDEILATLKELKFRRHKRAIDYPCDFSLYNSKSAPQLRTKVKVED